MLTIDVVFPEYFQQFLADRPYYTVVALSLCKTRSNGILLFDSEERKQRMLSYYASYDLILTSTTYGMHEEIKKELYLVLDGETNPEAEVKASEEDRLPIVVTCNDELKDFLKKENLKLLQLRLRANRKQTVVFIAEDDSYFTLLEPVEIRVSNCGPSSTS